MYPIVHCFRAWEGITDLVLAESACLCCVGEVCVCMRSGGECQKVCIMEGRSCS